MIYGSFLYTRCVTTVEPIDCSMHKLDKNYKPNKNNNNNNQFKLQHSQFMVAPQAQPIINM